MTMLKLSTKECKTLKGAYHTEILLTDGQWTIETLGDTIVVTPGFKSHRSTYYSLVKHVCYPLEEHLSASRDSVYQVVVYPDGNTTSCWRCQELIPDGVVAVWKFQNWEHLEYGR